MDMPTRVFILPSGATASSSRVSSCDTTPRLESITAEKNSAQSLNGDLQKEEAAQCSSNKNIVDKTGGKRGNVQESKVYSKRISANATRRKDGSEKWHYKNSEIEYWPEKEVYPPVNEASRRQAHTLAKSREEEMRKNREDRDAKYPMHEPIAMDAEINPAKAEAYTAQHNEGKHTSLSYQNQTF